MIVCWRDVKSHLLYRLVVVVVASATTGLATAVWFPRNELLDMDAHLRVNATYAYWCKV